MSLRLGASGSRPRSVGGCAFCLVWGVFLLPLIDGRISFLDLLPEVQALVGLQCDEATRMSLYLTCKTLFFTPVVTGNLFPSRPRMTTKAFEDAALVLGSPLLTEFAFNEVGPVPAARRCLSVVAIGHVDAGKSTLLARLTELTGQLEQALLTAAPRPKHRRAEGQQSRNLIDHLNRERESSTTLELHRWKLNYAKTEFALCDTPGQRRLVKTTISGICQADIGLLVVSAASGEFEAGISRTGATRAHTLLAFTHGIKFIVCAITKMDTDLLPDGLWNEARYIVVRDEISNLLRRIGFKPENVSCVPVSAWLGDGLVLPPVKAPWYKGPPLLSLLEAVPQPVRYLDYPFRFAVYKSFDLADIGRIVVGSVRSGIIKVDDQVTIAPEGFQATVASIARHRVTVPSANPGDCVSLRLTKFRREAVFHSGQMIGSLDRPPQNVTEIIAQFIVLDHPGEIRAGYSPVMDVHTAHVPVQITALLSKDDRRTGRIIEENPRSIRRGEAGMISIRPLKPLSVDPFSQVPPLGRFSLRDISITVAVGVVKNVSFGPYVPPPPGRMRNPMRKKK